MNSRDFYNIFAQICKTITKVSLVLMPKNTCLKHVQTIDIVDSFTMERRLPKYICSKVMQTVDIGNFWQLTVDIWKSISVLDGI